MTEKVKKIIIDRHKSSNGSCGISALSIAISLNCKFSEINNDLLQLHKQNFFKVREGINGKLLFYNFQTQNKH
jgi:hypothetical protein